MRSQLRRGERCAEVLRLAVFVVVDPCTDPEKKMMWLEVTVDELYVVIVLSP